MTSASNQYLLHVLSGPPAGPFALTDDHTIRIGRSMECAVCLAHESVSRRHAHLLRRDDAWYIVDVGSAAGTYVGATRLSPHQPTRLDAGDLIRIGPWTLHFSLKAQVERAARTIDDTGSGTRRIETVGAGVTLAASRLALLTEGLEALHQGGDEYRLAATALRAALKGASCTRGAVLRTLDRSGEVEILASVDPSGGAMTFSRSLINAAREGRVVMLSDEHERASSASIVESNISAAICSPVLVGDAVAAFLYLDSRSRDDVVRQDAGAFCEAVARALGLALANRQRQDLQRRQLQLASELQAAREVQQFIMPAPTGDLGFVRYAMHSHAGAMVAGDLFDATRLTDGRVCVLLGDVSGHGAGSAMLMAAVQAQFAAHLAHTPDVARAFTRVNAYLCQRDLGGRFVSLIAVVIAPTGECELIDAGHGYWLRFPPRHEDSPHGARSIPLGIDPDTSFPSHHLTLAKSDRLLLYSDGVIDERGHADQPFGVARLAAAITPAAGPQGDVDAVFDALRAHSGLDGAGDDCTVASIEFLG